MADEINALLNAQTWSLVPPPKITTQWGANGFFDLSKNLMARLIDSRCA